MATTNIIYRNATLSDLEFGLPTIFPCAFHQVNMKTLCPDTPLTREWWRQAWKRDISKYDVLIAYDTLTSQIVGSVQLREMPPGSFFGGFIAENKDHAVDLWKAAASKCAADEELIVGDRKRGIVEVMAVDYGYQGQGIGTQLMSRLCEIADRRRLPVFLVTSQSGGFYRSLGLGFSVVEQGPVDSKGNRSAVLLREAGNVGDG